MVRPIVQDDSEDIDVAELPDKHHRRHRHFWQAWMRSPRKMGSVVPSSRALARILVKQLDLSVSGTVVELGAGTGVVTHELLQGSIPRNRMLVMEREPKLHDLLVTHFPGVNIVCADAMNLQDVLAAQGITEVNAIVSSLPLLSMPRSIRRAIVAQMAAVIGPRGKIIQYTYGPASPIGPHSLQTTGLQGRKVKTVLTNIPPAHVWVYTGGRG